MKTLSLTVRRGAKADIPIRLESDTPAFVPITAMSQSAPIQIIAPAHGLPNGWRAAVMNAGGMIELNTPWNRLTNASLRRIARIDADTVAFPDVNSASFRTYTGGGQLAHYPPIDLAAYNAAAMDVRSAVGETLLAHYSTADGTLELDAANAALWIRLNDAATAELPAGTLVFDIELAAVAGGTTAICAPDSTLLVLPEITTT